LDEPWHNKVDSMINKKDVTSDDIRRASELAAAHGAHPGWIQTRILKFTKPNTYAFIEFKRATKGEFAKYWMMLSEDEQKQIQESLQKEQRE